MASVTRKAGLAVAAAVAATALAPVTAPAAAAVAGAAVQGPPRPLCYPDQIYRVDAPEGLIVRNDIFGAGSTCIAVKGRAYPWFRIVSARPGGGTFPEIFYGRAYGLASAGTVFPVNVATAQRVRTSWQTFPVRPPGLWNKAYDIWFSRHRHTVGQAGGAELMIWLDTSFGPSPNPVVTIEGSRYHFGWHKACNARWHKCWNFMIFRRVRPVAGVRHLQLGPFIRYAMQHQLIASSWWLQSVEAGFETWSGGVGNGTRSFEVTP